MKVLAVVFAAFIIAGCGGDNKNSPTTELESYRGKWLVINYWAKWCKPCLKEIPELNEFDRITDSVAVVGVNYDGATGEDLSQQIRDFAIEFPILAQDPATELGIKRPSVLPTTLIINSQGELIHTLIGPQTTHSLAKATEQPQPRRETPGS